MTTRPTRHLELAEFVGKHAIKRGRFVLASGAVSDIYCDGKLATFDPEGIALVADAMLEEIRDLEAEAIGGLEMGAIPIVAAVALRSHQLNRPLKAFVVRKETKSHGTKKQIEGPLPAPGARVVIVDDVVTKGGSILQAVEAARTAGLEVVCAMSVLDREAGGSEALAGAGVPYRPLLTISEVLHDHVSDPSSRTGCT